MTASPPETTSKFVLFPRLKAAAVVDGAPNTNGLLLPGVNENPVPGCTGPGCKVPDCTIAGWLEMNGRAGWLDVAAAAAWPNSDGVDWKLNDGGADADTTNPNDGTAAAPL